MTATTVARRLTTEILALLGETFEDVQGHYLDRGTSLFETLETISAEEASRPVSATCATIAAQVEHTRYYLAVLGEYMAGRKPQGVDWGKSWETRAVTPDEWEASKARLRDAYRAAVAMIKTLEPWEGEDGIGEALAVVVHTAYHLGEIRQALCTVR